MIAIPMTATTDPDNKEACRDKNAHKKETLFLYQRNNSQLNQRQLKIPVACV